MCHCWLDMWPQSGHMLNEHKPQMWKGKHLNNRIVLNRRIISPLCVLLLSHMFSLAAVCVCVCAPAWECVGDISHGCATDPALHRLSGGTLTCSAYPSWVCSNKPSPETVYVLITNRQEVLCVCVGVDICVHVMFWHPFTRPSSLKLKMSFYLSLIFFSWKILQEKYF